MSGTRKRTPRRVDRPGGTRGARAGFLQGFHDEAGRRLRAVEVVAPARRGRRRRGRRPSQVRPGRRGFEADDAGLETVGADDRADGAPGRPRRGGKAALGRPPAPALPGGRGAAPPRPAVRPSGPADRRSAWEGAPRTPRAPRGASSRPDVEASLGDAGIRRRAGRTRGSRGGDARSRPVRTRPGPRSRRQGRASPGSSRSRGPTPVSLRGATALGDVPPRAGPSARARRRRRTGPIPSPRRDRRAGEPTVGPGVRAYGPDPRARA